MSECEPVCTGSYFCMLRGENVVPKMTNCGNTVVMEVIKDNLT